MPRRQSPVGQETPLVSVRYPSVAVLTLPCTPACSARQSVGGPESPEISDPPLDGLEITERVGAVQGVHQAESVSP